MPYVPRGGHPAPHGQWYTLSLLLEALAATGRIKATAALHPAAEDMIGAGYVVTWACAALPRTTAGIAAACARNWPCSEQHHQTAIQQADTMLHKLAQPIARYWYAEMLRMRDEPGDRTRARTLLRETVPMCEAIGMPLYARQASAKLAILGS